MFAVSVKKTKNKGRGVFAEKAFIKGEIIEIAPVLILSPKDSENYEKTILSEYLYEWKNELDGAIVLGLGLIYNHSYTPNAEYVRNFADQTMTYQAIKPIKKGEEISVNYNGEPANADHIDWFKVRK